MELLRKMRAETCEESMRGLPARGKDVVSVGNDTELGYGLERRGGS
jgi:hypothetical protein